MLDLVIPCFSRVSEKSPKNEKNITHAKKVLKLAFDPKTAQIVRSLVALVPNQTMM